MRINLPFGILLAFVLHGVVILFGGIFLNSHKANLASLQQVALLSEDDIKKEKEKEEEPKEMEEMDTEEAPDAEEVIKSLEAPAINEPPALEAASLSAIEAALSGAGGGGDFASSMDFSSGGRIGGKGKAGAFDESMEKAFSLSEIDQKPRVIFQAAPAYPASLRTQKLEGVVSIKFIVDPQGKVMSPKIDRSTNIAFEKPAIDAIKQWKFEPAVKGGQRVSAKMRASIRFQPG